jgi:16S rRNA (adenine1518-N6/adenine1519-N6)-dimethyltransferase
MVRPKKKLGQHFLADKNIAERIVQSLAVNTEKQIVLEIGPGTGVLTHFLTMRDDIDLFVIEIDQESIAYLTEYYPELESRIIAGDVLNFDIRSKFNSPFSIIGNFPYNISSQIFFKVLEHRDIVQEVVCM